MWELMRIKPLYLFLCLLSSLPAKALPQPQLDFKDRGNRNEGVKRFNVSVYDLELLSFIGYLENVGVGKKVDLKIKFFMNEDTSLFITAKELMPQKSYLMKPSRTRWPKGWQEFSSWPTGQVLNPLGINISQLGILGRLKNDNPGSGEVAPLIIYHSKPISQIKTYTLYLRPKENLSKVQYSLYRVGSQVPIIKKITLHNIYYGGMAFPIVVDLSNQQTGYYKLIIICDFENQFGGPKRTYTFYHNRVVEKDISSK